MHLTSRLRQLEEAGATGRLDVAGTPGGRVYLDGGLVTCAEQHGHPTLLLAMAEAGLFAPPEWAAALKAPAPDRWRALVNGDDERLEKLVGFAAEFTSEQLQVLLPCHGPATFVAGAAHPLGTLAAWTLDDLVGPAPGGAGFDRSEFLELLSEISPLVQ